MTESTEGTEPSGGFDRRSLIKKGLVVGGAAVALPVITTFDAPAFAASPTPENDANTRVKFNTLITIGLVNLVEVGILASLQQGTSDTDNPCGLTNWANLNNGAPGTVDGPTGIIQLHVPGTLVYTSSTCTFVAGARTSGSGCTAGVISDGGHTITFALDPIDVQITEHVYLKLHC